MKQEYAIYQIEDFLTDDDFIRWVKYPDTASDTFWQEVIRVYPHQKQVIEKAAHTIHNLQQALKKNIAPEEATDIWVHIEAEMEQPRTDLKVVSHKRGYWLAAASVALLVSFSWWMMDRNTQKEGKMAQYTEGGSQHIVNNEDKPLAVNLPDGSKVLLEKNASIVFEPDFNGNQRTVQLSGEALFDVVKNTQKPFVVYADDVVTKVLGTRFRITAIAHERNVTVSVLRGRVSVFPKKKEQNINPETEGLILTPNQQAIFEKANEQMSRHLVENPVLMDSQIRFDKSVFDDTPVATIFEALEQAYGVNIIFDKTVMKTCTLTMRFRNETFFEKLTVICKSIGASYKIEGADIKIEGKGCD
ncbi:MAG: FecR domain-containing protein [Saprospiraceae bacterium]|nr:FecR domain-containing protein [Saprospiraceae bacterium]